MAAGCRLFTRQPSAGGFCTGRTWESWAGVDEAYGIKHSVCVCQKAFSMSTVGLLLGLWGLWPKNYRMTFKCHRGRLWGNCRKEGSRHPNLHVRNLTVSRLQVHNTPGLDPSAQISMEGDLKHSWQLPLRAWCWASSFSIMFSAPLLQHTCWHL